MNFSSILSEIERLDPEVYERTSARRNVIKNWTRRVSLAALPFALGSLFNKAYGKTNDAISDVLQTALQLEYLEYELYRAAVAATEVILPKTQLIPTVTGLELPAIKTMMNHEYAHVSLFYNMIQGMGVVPGPFPKIDFSGGKGSYTGPFVQLFKDYGTFLSVAQMFEDLGVRALGGEITTLKPNNEVLTLAMRVHSVEARHAAHIRLMRSQTPDPLSDSQNIKPWITMAESGINSSDYQAAYDGEQNTSQVGIEISNIAGFVIPDTAASEAFDEPITMVDIKKVTDLFFLP